MNKTKKVMNIYEKANAWCIDIQKELRVSQLSTLNLIQLSTHYSVAPKREVGAGAVK